MVLPYMDQAPLFNQIVFTSNTQASANATALNGKLLPGFGCPTDPDSGLQNNARESGYLPAGSGTYSMAMSYMPSGGPLKTNMCVIADNGSNCKGENGGAASTTGIPGPGMFNGGPVAYRIRDCTDGTSNTLLMGEALPIYNSFGHYFISHMNAGTTNPPPNYLISSLKTTCPKALTGRSSPETPCLYAAMGFQSLHTGGVHVLLADSSVRFVSDSINYAIWTNIGARADGQTVGDY